ncbi:50S ribosomal protein L18a [Candidatus Micrarchaeota archaeon]|nr:50S ribosomal protein L18a [Candidatus Micrarchaeota archaeon]
MKFSIKGEFKLGRENREFSKEVEAESENHAKELLYSLLGAQNGVKRTTVKITHIEKV